MGKGKVRNFIIIICEKLYDRNSISYRFLRKLYHAERGYKIIYTLKCLVILPCIPIWNYMAAKEIKEVKRTGSIYPIRNGKVKFYLPDLDLFHGEFIQNRIFLERDYFEISHLSLLKKYVKRDAVILDIGANIGNHTVFFAKECGARKIYSFEPTRKTFLILKENIRINQLDSRVVTMNIALGSKKSNVRVIANEKDAGSNYVEENLNGNIAMRRLDDLSISESIEYVKIDVEGYEYEVLKGSRNTIMKDKPNIFIEIFDANYNKVDSLLRRMGYQCQLKTEQDYLYRCVTD